MKLTKDIEMLFALLRASLHNEQPVIEPFKDAGLNLWESCYAVAAKQGVLALAWDGVELLPAELHPPKQLKFKWAMNVEKYEARHKRYCETVQQLQQFYKEHGIVAVQMKGVGFSANYNRPHHREGGDIDIYTFSADSSKLSHKEANEKADNLMKSQGIEVDSHSYKHSNFNYKGIPVENHKLFINVMINKKFMIPLNELLIKSLNPQTVKLWDEYEILVPSPQFNTLFISCHAFQHYGSGIALHHLYDWAALMKNSGLHIPHEFPNIKFLRAIAAFTHLSNKLLGTDIKLDTFPEGYEEISGEMLKEMLYPIYCKTVPYDNKAQIFIYKCKKVLRSAKLANDVFGQSIVGRLTESFIAHIKHPSTIFGR